MIIRFILGIVFSLAIYWPSMGQDIEMVWGSSLGGMEDDRSNIIEKMPNGHIIVGGYFSGTTNFNPQGIAEEVTSNGSKDFFIAEYNTDGELFRLWTGGGSDWDEVNDLTFDNLGNIYFTGRMRGTVELNDGAITLVSNGNDDFLVGKINAQGELEWAFNLGGPGEDVSQSIHINQLDEIIVAGHYEGAIDMDPGPNAKFTYSHGEIDVFISKYSQSGAYLWGGNFGGADFDYLEDFELGINDDYIITGRYLYAADLNMAAQFDSILISNGEGDVFLARYTSTGQFLWARSFGGVDYDSGKDLEIAANGDIYVTGYYQYDADLNPDSLETLVQSNGFFDVFISKFDSSGNFIWGKSIGGTGKEDVHALRINPSNNITLAGYFEDSVDFNPGIGDSILGSAGGFDGFVLELDEDGEFDAASRIGGGNYDEITSFDYKDEDELFLTGTFKSAIDLDTGPDVEIFVSNGGKDIFISAYEPKPVVIIGVENSVNLDVMVFPNPAGDEIKYLVDTRSDVEVSLLGADGRELKRKKGSEGFFDLRDLSAGMYLLKIEGGEISLFQKFLHF